MWVLGTFCPQTLAVPVDPTRPPPLSLARQTMREGPRLKQLLRAARAPWTAPRLACTGSGSPDWLAALEKSDEPTTTLLADASYEHRLSRQGDRFSLRLIQDQDIHQKPARVVPRQSSRGTIDAQYLLCHRPPNSQQPTASSQQPAVFPWHSLTTASPLQCGPTCVHSTVQSVPECRQPIPTFAPDRRVSCGNPCCTRTP